MSAHEEREACIPIPVNPKCFNPNCHLPYGLTVEHVRKAMEEFINFLGFINQQLCSKGLPQLENFLMPANFSSMVGDFINIRIPEHCPDLVKNQYHNGHPDLIPKGRFPDEAIQYTQEGIEIKASRYASSWART